MVDEKNEILSEKMKDESKQKRMESMLKLLKDEPDGVVNNTYVKMMEALGYDIELTYVKRESL